MEEINDNLSKVLDKDIRRRKQRKRLTGILILLLMLLLIAIIGLYFIFNSKINNNSLSFDIVICTYEGTPGTASEFLTRDDFSINKDSNGDNVSTQNVQKFDLTNPIEIVYKINNKSTREYNYFLNLSKLKADNCQFSWCVNNGKKTVLPDDNLYINYSAPGEITISVVIEVKDKSLSQASCTGDIEFTVSMV